MQSIHLSIHPQYNSSTSVDIFLIQLRILLVLGEQSQFHKNNHNKDNNLNIWLLMSNSLSTQFSTKDLHCMLTIHNIMIKFQIFSNFSITSIWIIWRSDYYTYYNVNWKIIAEKKDKILMEHEKIYKYSIRDFWEKRFRIHSIDLGCQIILRKILDKLDEHLQIICFIREEFNWTFPIMDTLQIFASELVLLNCYFWTNSTSNFAFKKNYWHLIQQFNSFLKLSFYVQIVQR